MAESNQCFSLREHLVFGPTSSFAEAFCNRIAIIVMAKDDSWKVGRAHCLCYKLLYPEKEPMLRYAGASNTHMLLPCSYQYRYYTFMFDW